MLNLTQNELQQLSLNQLNAIYCVYKDLDYKTQTVNCCTCGRTITITEIEDCYHVFGHYIARSKNPKLKNHPKNTHAQCTKCNMSTDEKIFIEYKKYMFSRYGNNIDEILNNENDTSIYNSNYYINKITNITKQHTIIDETDNNFIITSFNTYSNSYKQDLDELCKFLGSKTFIEYERL